jgi:hypothetical protein
MPHHGHLRIHGASPEPDVILVRLGHVLVDKRLVLHRKKPEGEFKLQRAKEQQEKLRLDKNSHQLEGSLGQLRNLVRLVQTDEKRLGITIGVKGKK